VFISPQTQKLAETIAAHLPGRTQLKLEIKESFDFQLSIEATKPNFTKFGIPSS
jgi:hypothetical protein